jgi:hypothetical protein
VSCLRLQATLAPSNPATPGYKHACGAVTPSWTRVERHTRGDLQQTWGDTGRGLRADSNAPQVGQMLCTYICSGSIGNLLCAVYFDEMLLNLPARSWTA